MDMKTRTVNIYMVININSFFYRQKETVSIEQKRVYRGGIRNNQKIETIQTSEKESRHSHKNGSTIGL